MSDSRSLWAEAFAKAQSELPDIPKNKTAKIPTKNGGEYSYKYADLPDVLAVCRPVLNKHGLSVGQSVGGDSAAVAVTTRIFHSGGHVEEFGPVTLSSGSDARGAGSAVTYARRYGLCAALGIAPDEDDDGAHASRREPEPPVEAFDLSGWLPARLQIFGKWDDDRQKSEWVKSSKDVLGGKPVSVEEASRVLEDMSTRYYEEHPPTDDEAPF